MNVALVLLLGNLLQIECQMEIYILMLLGGQGGAGVMYEVDSIGNLVWGPYNASSPKGFRYECDYPGIKALESYMNILIHLVLMPTAITENMKLKIISFSKSSNRSYNY